MIPMAHNVFTVQDLTFGYTRDNLLFEDLSLTIREGRITTLIGANGSGKSTLFNLLTKNLSPLSGQIFLRGGNVADLRLFDFAKLVAIVHQTNTAPSDLTVEDLVSFGRFPHRHGTCTAHRAEAIEEDERCVNWALDVTNLQDVRKRAVSALSGGQRQRVWIAMSLAQGSSVLLLDEPTTYLDIRYQLDILELVRTLNREYGMTIIMVLHDMNQALHYSDEVIALAHGRIAAQGAPEEIVTGELLREVYGIDLDVVSVNGKPFVLNVGK